jgi:ATP-dependent protease ClpP protease subunit
VPTIFMPSIIERSSRGERTYDIYSRLLMDRIVFLGNEIDDDVRDIVVDLGSEKNDAIHEQPREDVVRPLAAAGALDDRRHEDGRHC